MFHECFKIRLAIHTNLYESGPSLPLLGRRPIRPNGRWSATVTNLTTPETRRRWVPPTPSNFKFETSLSSSFQVRASKA